MNDEFILRLKASKNTVMNENFEVLFFYFKNIVFSYFLCMIFYRNFFYIILLIYTEDVMKKTFLLG